MGARRSGIESHHLSPRGDRLGQRRYRGHRHGQILIVTLISLVLLTGLIFYVYNLGDQVNRRLEMQNAADAAAISGAGWMARSMNLIAMNNVTISRMVGLAIVLDSLPLAAEMTVAEETGEDSLPVPLEDQLRRGVPRSSLEQDDFLYRGLQEIYTQMNYRRANQDDATHLDLIEMVDSYLDQRDERSGEGVYDVSQATQWPDGTIWQAIDALDDLSRATVVSAGSLAQSNAYRFGLANNAAAALLAPVSPSLPARRGDWEDYRPVLSDCIEIINDPNRAMEEHRIVETRLVETLQNSADILKEIEQIGYSRWGIHGRVVPGGAIPDFEWPHRLGPFASVYEWRDPIRVRSSQWGVSDFEWDTIGYDTYGPVEHAIRTVLGGFGEMGTSRGRGGLAYTSRFPYHVRKIAKMKLAYGLGLTSPQPVQYADKWIADFDEAKDFASDPNNSPQILRARYYRVQVDSKVRWDSSQWLTGELGETAEERTFWSWQIQPDLSDEITTQPLWRWVIEPWLNGQWWEPSGEKVMDHVWIRKRERQVRSYPHFNWIERPTYDEDGNVRGYDLYTLYTVSWYVWGGMEIRDEVLISNPFGDASADQLPAPYLLNTDGERVEWIETLDGNQAVRVAPFEFLGVAMRGQAARQMPARFASHNPAGRTVTVAQVKLFNNSSWDLWTQDWQVQLAPVSDWDRWVDELSQPADLGGQTGPSQNDFDSAMQYLDGLSPMAEEFLNH